MADITIPVQGMSCPGCVAGLTQALRALPGVGGVEVSLEQGQARVRHEQGGVGVLVMIQAIEDAGFDVPSDWPGRPSVG